LLDIPEALSRITAESLAMSVSSAALKVTVWFVFQFDVVNVNNVEPGWTLMSASPLKNPTDTVTSEGGCALNLTWNVAVPPSGTESASTEVIKFSTSLSASVAVTSLLGTPEALSRITADPLDVSTSSAAPKVTVWFMFQFDVVNVKGDADWTLISVSPLNRATDTVTFEAG
jgi:hypothetical protein